jgi:hypothetical protein
VIVGIRLPVLFFIHLRWEVQAVALDGKGYFHHEVSMSLRAPTEHEYGLYSQNMLPSRFVIPAHAGIVRP